MKRAGLKVITYDGVSFPAINGGKWNLASNYSFRFLKILSECGIDDDDGLTVSLLFRYLTNGRMFYLVKRNILETDLNRGYDALCLYVDDRTMIDNTTLAVSLLELMELFGHPEVFSYKELLEDSLPAIFRQDYTQDDTSNLPSNRPMTGNRIGYLEYANTDELEVILSAGYNENYDNFGFILLTDNPVRIESSLPRLFLPELILHRQLSKPKLSFVEEEAAIEEEIDVIGDVSEEKGEDVEKFEDKKEVQEEEEQEEKEKEIQEVGEKEKEGEEQKEEEEEETLVNVGREEETISKEEKGEEDRTEGICESVERNEEASGGKKTKYFFYGFLTATIIYLIIFAIYETFHF